MKAEKILLLAAALLSAYALGLATAQQFGPPAGGIATVILKQLPAAEKFEASIDIVAVKQQGEAGVLSTANVEVVSGKGRVLFSLNPFTEPDTQQSAETAAAVAQQYTGKSLADRDVIYTIENSDVQLVGGPSAGAALAVATIAALEGKAVRPDTVMTGTINADGTIGQIGGVLEKAAACADANKSLFLVPAGQSTVTYYTQQVTEQRRGFITIQRVRYVPAAINLNDYSKEQGWNLEIKEVSNIQEAAALMLE